MADDGIDEILHERSDRLLDNIIGSDAGSIIKSMTYSTKERLLKDYLVKEVEKFFWKLNQEFPDVNFNYQWRFSDAHEDFTYEGSLYNQDMSDDQEGYVGFDDANHLNELFYSIPLDQIGMRIEYYWSRKCSLKCEHKIRRFMIVNMPKILDFIGFIRCGMPVRSFVKEFIPDFFYDPMKLPAKRGRPRKVSHS